MQIILKLHRRKFKQGSFLIPLKIKHLKENKMIYKSIKELKEEYANRKINKEELSKLLRLPKDGCSNLTFNDSFAIFLYNRIIK